MQISKTHKMLLQRLWLTGLSLDEHLPAPIIKKWSTFESVLNIKKMVSTLAVLIFGNLKVRVEVPEHINKRTEALKLLVPENKIVSYGGNTMMQSLFT